MKKQQRNNDDIITLSGENGEKLDFELCAEIELDDYSYLVLKPLDNRLGLDPDEAIIFRLESDGYMEPEWDDEIIDRISQIYNNDLNN